MFSVNFVICHPTQWHERLAASPLPTASSPYPDTGKKGHTEFCGRLAPTSHNLYVKGDAGCLSLETKRKHSRSIFNDSWESQFNATATITTTPLAEAPWPDPLPTQLAYLLTYFHLTWLVFIVKHAALEHNFGYSNVNIITHLLGSDTLNIIMWWMNQERAMHVTPKQKKKKIKEKNVLG